MWTVTSTCSVRKKKKNEYETKRLITCKNIVHRQPQAVSFRRISLQRGNFCVASESSSTIAARPRWVCWLFYRVDP